MPIPTQWITKYVKINTYDPHKALLAQLKFDACPDIVHYMANNPIKTQANVRPGSLVGNIYSYNENYGISIIHTQLNPRKNLPFCIHIQLEFEITGKFLACYVLKDNLYVFDGLPTMKNRICLGL